MQLIRLIKMCPNESYSRVQVGKHLPDMFSTKNSLKQGDALSPFLLNFALEYTIRRVLEMQDSLKQNGTCKFLVYADDVNIRSRSIRTIKKNKEALIVASKETGLSKCSEN
jgi:hypothetical protein